MTYPTRPGQGDAEGGRDTYNKHFLSWQLTVMPNKTLLSPREPMQSWIMKLWLQSHEEREWPDLSINQQNALHVTNAKRHYTIKDIESMCSGSFFKKHDYKYVEKASASYIVDDEYYASCSSEGGSLDIRLECHDRTDGRISATFYRDTGACRGAYEEPIVPTYCETSGEKKGIESCLHYSAVEVVGRTLNCENGNSSTTENSATYAGLYERHYPAYQVLISNQSNVRSHNSEVDNDYDDVLGEDQTAM